jgi:hypothetical protein
MRATSLIAFGIFLVLGLIVVDPGVSHAMSSAPFAVLLIATAFPVDPVDRVMTLAEWRAKNRISASTERRMRKAGLGPKLIHISAGQFGVRVRDDIEWMERGGASGAPASDADAPTRKTGRNTGPARAARLAKRARRKDSSTLPNTGDSPASPKGRNRTPPGSAASPAEQPQHATTTRSANATA